MTQPKDWEHIDIDCWNYLKGCKGGLAKRVRVSKERFCESDCESYWCPLNKSKSSVVTGAKKP